MKTFHVTVSPEKNGERLDLALVGADLGLSRRKIRAAIDAGGAYVNKKRVRIASRKVRSGDKLRLEFDEGALKAAKAQDFRFRPQDILYDADDIIAVNKPPGLPSQSTRNQSVLHVETVLKAYLREQGEKPGKSSRLILVHRLDMETSGVLLLARTPARAAELSDLFRERKVKKSYLAIVHGIPDRPAFVERASLSPIDKKTGMVSAVKSGKMEGKTAVTRFRMLDKNEEASLALLEARPETGRSHQIRVHLETRELPLVGDKRYGNRVRNLPPELAALAARHQLLHARSLELPLATGKVLCIKADPPQTFVAFAEQAGLKLQGVI